MNFVRFSTDRTHQISFLISGYQFPDAVDDYDANWVVLRINAKTGSQQWQAESACLLTWDLLIMDHWFRTIAERKKLGLRRFSGMETDFTLLYRGPSRDHHRFYVRLSDGLAPPHSLNQVAHVTFPIEVAAPELATCCQVLNQLVKLFPPRGRAGQKWSNILRERGLLL